jgi:hypothetical protein
MTTEEQLDRVNRIVKLLKLEFDHDRKCPALMIAHWGTSVWLEDHEIARMPNDEKLKQFVKDRLLSELQKAVDYIKSLQ